MREKGQRPPLPLFIVSPAINQVVQSLTVRLLRVDNSLWALSMYSYLPSLGQKTSTTVAIVASPIMCACVLLSTRRYEGDCHVYSVVHNVTKSVQGLAQQTVRTM